ncbi:MAG: sulfotransferase family protein [Paracoccaceae bacterium]|nr:sulfotransferase family protein [Paracoccaceae bacterium]
MTNDIFTIGRHPLVSTADAMPKQVMLLVCPCRSGSTIMLRAFGHAGVAAFFQPIKNALRWGLLGERRPWEVPSEIDQKTVFLKETFGPFRLEETTYDPLECLLAVGLPAERINLVVLMRDPAAVWLSWQKHWSAQTSPTLFADAWHACLKCVKTARAHGVSVQSLRHAQFSAEPLLAMRSLFEMLNLDFPAEALDDWIEKQGFGEAGSGVFMPDEPDVFVTPGAHDPVIAARRIHPIASNGSLDATDRMLLKRAGAIDAYHALSQELAVCDHIQTVHGKDCVDDVC